MTDGIKKELSRVREQKRAAHAALVKIAHDRGFFNPEWGQKSVDEADTTSWMDGLTDEHFGSFDECGYPSYYSIQVEDTPEQRQRQESVAWSRWWVKFKEWDLLGQPGTPYPAQLQKVYTKFLALDPDIKDQAKEWGDREFYRKHPGFSGNPSTAFPDELILACWAAED